MNRSFFGFLTPSHHSTAVATPQSLDHGQFRTDIAGLRALAVIPVLLFHANVPSFSGGFVGVDIFFVISGYLISMTIAKDLAKGQFSLAKFYERRARRILPALAGVILFCLLAGREYLYAGTRDSFANSLLWLSFFSSNLYFKQEFGYFDNDAITKPLLHTWSLSIEEQFYLLFPIILAVAWKYARRFVGLCVVGIVGISFLISIRTVSVDRMGAFYLIQSRAWELALGALLACFSFPAIQLRTRIASRTIREGIAMAGLLGIVLPIYFYTKSTRFPGVAALPPCLGTLAIIWANTDSNTLVGRLLSLRPLTAIGAISYSLYLWHWPLLVFARLRHGEDLTVPANCVVLCVAGMFACLSYWLIETPTRNHKFLPRREYVLSLASMTLVLMGVTGIFFSPHKNHSGPVNASTYLVNSTTLNSTSVNSTVETKAVQVAVTDETDDEADVDEPQVTQNLAAAEPPALPESSVAQLLEDPLQVTFARSPKTDYWAVADGVYIYRNGSPKKSGILVLGDSVASQWANGLEKLQSAYNITYYIQTLSNSVPLIDTYVPYVEQAFKLPNKLRNESFGKILDAVNTKHVILAGAWQSYINDEPQILESFELHTADKAGTTAERQREIFATQLEKTIRFFTERGCKVWLMLEPPEYESNIPLRLAAFVKANSSVTISYEPVEKKTQQREAAVNLISGVLAKFQSIEAEILDPFELFCADGFCITVHDNRSLYYDKMHLSYHGSIFANKVFQNVIDEIKHIRSLEKNAASAPEDTLMR